jgi:hypothetical protein
MAISLSGLTTPIVVSDSWELNLDSIDVFVNVRQLSRQIMFSSRAVGGYQLLRERRVIFKSSEEVEEKNP